MQLLASHIIFLEIYHRPFMCNSFSLLYLSRVLDDVQFSFFILYFLLAAVHVNNWFWIWMSLKEQVGRQYMWGRPRSCCRPIRGSCGNARATVQRCYKFD